MTEENKIRDAADAIKGVVEAVPVYEDAIQPAAKELGTALQTVARTINVALAPISALVWGYDRILDFIETRVAEKLSKVPAENIVTPKPEVAGPALESLRYTGHDENLRELYANLLATSMDKKTATYAHPAYVEIIRNISPDEARIMRLFARCTRFPVIDIHAQTKENAREYEPKVVNYSHVGKEAGCEHLHLAQSYIDNLCRLELLCINESARIAAPNTYEPLEEDPVLSPLKKQIEASGRVVDFKRKILALTTWGTMFIQACVIEKYQAEQGAAADTDKPRR